MGFLATFVHIYAKLGKQSTVEKACGRVSQVYGGNTFQNVFVITGKRRAENPGL